MMKRSSFETELAIQPALKDIPVRIVSVPPEARLVVHSDPSGPGSDRFRYLRLKLRELRRNRPLQAIAVTSAQPQDGKSTVALNLATALAEGGKRSVLCVEADLYHPTVCDALGVKAYTGLAEVLEDRADPLASILRLDPLGWYVLPSGGRQENPTERLSSEYLAVVITKLRQHFEWILVDSPPVLAVTDSLILSEQLDGALLVVRAGETPKESVEEALTLLGEKRVAGIVLNETKSLDLTYSKYYGTYYPQRPK
jgi:capsular exopolysaccharide synthesis family protein